MVVIQMLFFGSTENRQGIWRNGLEGTWIWIVGVQVEKEKEKTA